MSDFLKECHSIHFPKGNNYKFFLSKNIMLSKAKHLKNNLLHIKTLLLYRKAGSPVVIKNFLRPDSSLAKNLTHLSKNKYYSGHYLEKKRKVKYNFVLNSVLPFLKNHPESLIEVDYNNEQKLKIMYNESLYLDIFNKQHINISSEDMPINENIPFGLLVDSEYKDKNQNGCNVFDNIRDVYPVSLSVGIFSYDDYNSVFYRNYIFSEPNYNHLMNSKNVNASYKRSLKSFEYGSLQDCSLMNGVIKDPVVLRDSTVFTSLLKEMYIPPELKRTLLYNEEEPTRKRKFSLNIPQFSNEKVKKMFPQHYINSQDSYYDKKELIIKD